jgi:division protein CdvB (Snf7/Vps24/ESCRT-III family)
LSEEVKLIDNEFTQAILKESTDFLQALSNFQIVQVTDISQLVRMKTVHMQEIESMGKVSDHFKTMFKEMLIKMDD